MFVSWNPELDPNWHDDDVPEILLERRSIRPFNEDLENHMVVMKANQDEP